MCIYKRKIFEPNFDNILKVLKRKIPDRPTLFEFFTNYRIIGKLSGEIEEDNSTRLSPFRRIITSFKNSGYDYTTISAWRTKTMEFPKVKLEKQAIVSLNSGNSFPEYIPDENYLAMISVVNEY